MSEQMSFDMAHARLSDPETSHEAAASQTPDHLGRAQAYLLAILREQGPCDDETLRVRYADRANFARIGGSNPPRMSASGVRTRRCELVRKGLVADTGERVVLASGRRAIVWQAL